MIWIARLLLGVDRVIAKIETIFLCASLAALLLLTLYSVAYRNFVAPIVLKMQASAIMAPSTASEPERKDTGDKGTGAAASSYAGDLDDEPEPPRPSANRYAGDLEDEPAPGNTEQAVGTPRTDSQDSQKAPQTEQSASVESGSPATMELPEDSALLSFLKWMSFGWIDAVTRHLLLYIAFFGAALAVRQRGHIKIEVLSRLFKGKAGDRLRIVLNAISMVACVFLTRAAWKFMMSEAEGGGTLYGSIPSWVGILIVPIGFGMLAFHFGLESLFGLLDTCGVASSEFEARRDALGLKEEVAR